jgi:hypothetical protein
MIEASARTRAKSTRERAETPIKRASALMIGDSVRPMPMISEAGT